MRVADVSDPLDASIVDQNVTLDDVARGVHRQEGRVADEERAQVL
jgi:hypothetical protein